MQRRRSLVCTWWVAVCARALPLLFVGWVYRWQMPLVVVSMLVVVAVTIMSDTMRGLCTGS